MVQFQLQFYAGKTIFIWSSKQQIQHAQLIIVTNAITQQFDTLKAHFNCWRTSHYEGGRGLFYFLLIISISIIVSSFCYLETQSTKHQIVFQNYIGMQTHWLHVYKPNKVPCLWMYCKNTNSKNHDLHLLMERLLNVLFHFGFWPVLILLAWSLWQNLMALYCTYLKTTKSLSRNKV